MTSRDDNILKELEYENTLPESAIDRITYPPYRLVWHLRMFNKKTELLAREIVLENFDPKAFRRIFKRPPSDPLIGGDWPITRRHRDKIEPLIGYRLHLLRYSYFIGASTLNYSDLKKGMSND